MGIICNSFAMLAVIAKKPRLTSKLSHIFARVPRRCQKTTLARRAKSVHPFAMSANHIARTPAPPYYAAIFTSERTAVDHGYAQMAERMLELAAQQPGFLGVESVRGADGFGITVAYWTDERAITQWKAQAEHQRAQQAGKSKWYADFCVRVAKVERAYGKT